MVLGSKGTYQVGWFSKYLTFPCSFWEATPHHQPRNLRPDLTEDDDPESTLGSITRQILGFHWGMSFFAGLREDSRY